VKTSPPRLALACLAALWAAPAQAIELELPVACDLGRDCWIQQYPDHDPGPGAADYRCGSQAYDGHDGTDIRIRDMSEIARGHPVLAAAAGTVKAVRDGVPDRLVRSETDRAAIRGQECGNGVLLAHAEGWETQYCHLRQGSVAVKPGEAVVEGTKLGEIGASGDAAFPHVHLTLRRAGETVDPFAPDARPGACGETQRSLWSKAAAAALAYRPAAVLGTGFAAVPLELADLENGTVAARRPNSDSPAMVAYGWAINLEAGDRILVSFEGPVKELRSSRAETLPSAKAQYLLYAGRKRPAAGWPPGPYAASFIVARGGTIILEERREMRLD
jgi:hypothetical protein